MPPRTPILALFALALVSAAPGRTPEEWLRVGNEACARRDFPAAALAYNHAAEFAADPGLVAFNRGVLALELGEHREAEVQFGRCLADPAIPPSRRAKAAYNCGVAQIARGGTAATYRLAALNLQACRDDPAAADELKADARHDLELAKLLWADARERETPPPTAAPPLPSREPDLPPRSPLPPPAQPTPTPPPEGPDEEEPLSPPPRVPPTPEAGDPPAGTRPPTPDIPGPPPPPGAGPLPVPPDAEPPKLSPEDARAWLARAAERLRAERKAAAKRNAGPERPHVRDW